MQDIFIDEINLMIEIEKSEKINLKSLKISSNEIVIVFREKGSKLSILRKRYPGEVDSIDRITRPWISD